MKMEDFSLAIPIVCQFGWSHFAALALSGEKDGRTCHNANWGAGRRSQIKTRHGVMFYHINIPSGYLTVCRGKSPFLIGKPSINGPFSMAMLNNQRVNPYCGKGTSEK
jgi:hypothetical protein